MGFIYDILPQGGDRHDVSPYWFAAIIRFQWKDTFTRTLMSQQPQNSSFTTPEGAMAEREDILIIDDVVSWNVTTSKSNHVSSCSLVIQNSNYNLLSELVSGDWIGFWAFDNKGDYLRVRDAVLNRKQANNFNDGFKFLGRIDAPRRRRSVAPNGQKRIIYNVTAHGFGELDSMLYYDKIFLDNFANDAIAWMVDFGRGADNLLMGARNTGNSTFVTSQLIVPRLIRLCLGTQSSQASPQSGSPDLDVNLSANQTANTNAAIHGALSKSYLTPVTVGSWLGIENNQTQKSYLSYSDLLRVYIGIQNYSLGGLATRQNVADGRWAGFLPDINDLDRNTYTTGQDLSGEYLFLPQIQRSSVWAFVNTFINAPIDEMYSCMRVDPNGVVMPTIVVRQNPMSTPWMKINTSFPVTVFVNLPRWRISSDLLVDEDVGRSNNLRFNAIRFLGQDKSASQPENINITNSAVTPPIIDLADVCRSGLRIAEAQLQAQVNIQSHANNDQPGPKWQQLLADILMGSHLKFTGSLIFKGLQEPICEGDNLEWENVIYHIEQITHSGAVSTQGGKEFTTTIQVSNGIDVFNDTDFIRYGDLGDLNAISTPPVDVITSNNPVEVVYPELQPDAASVEQETFKKSGG